MKLPPSHRFVGKTGLLFVFALAISAPAQTFDSHCIHEEQPPSDDCVVTRPKILNVYWDLSRGAWDADAGVALSHARLDAHILALTRSSYFSQLAQYRIGAPEFVGSVVTGGCQDPNTVGTDLFTVSPPTANLADMNGVLECAKRENPASFANANVIVLLLPPQVTPAWGTIMANTVLGRYSIPIGSCGDATHTGFKAFHVILADLPTAVIPLSCSQTFPATLFSISHELVEAMTDPDSILQTGFVDTFEADKATFKTAPLAPEIADVCNVQSVEFLDGRISQYWSEAGGTCVNGFSGGASATIASVTAFGAGRNMRIVINGIGFGSGPPDLTFVSGGVAASTLYFRLGDFTEAITDCTAPTVFEAGHAFSPGNTGIGVNIGSWTDGEIRIHGFGGTFGTPAGTTPGDFITVQAANQNDGLWSNCVGTRVPLPARIIDQPRATPVTPGATSVITGQLADANLGAEGGLPVTLAANAGTLAATQLQSGDDGQLEVSFSAPASAGPVNITATFPQIPRPIPPVTWTVPVAPVIDSVAPVHGDKDGGTTVTITGRGFVSGSTAVTFGGVSATSPADVLSRTQIRVQAPAATNVGAVPIAVSVGGVPATTKPLFTYVIPFAPFLTFSGQVCEPALVAAEVFDHDGNPVPREPVTLTATKGRLVTGNTNSETTTSNTNAAGLVSARMVTAGLSSTELAVAGHTQRRPSPDEVASTRVWSKNFCEKLRTFRYRRLQVRFVIGEPLIPEIADGCLVCETPSKFRVDWRSQTPALRGLSVTGFTEDASLAKNFSAAVLGADKAGPLLERTPISGEVVGFVELIGNAGKASLELNYTGAAKNEKFAVLRLERGKWIPTQSPRASSGGFRARLSSSGIHAIIVRR